MSGTLVGIGSVHVVTVCKTSTASGSVDRVVGSFFRSAVMVLSLFSCVVMVLSNLGCVGGNVDLLWVPGSVVDLIWVPGFAAV